MMAHSTLVQDLTQKSLKQNNVSHPILRLSIHQCSTTTRTTPFLSKPLQMTSHMSKAPQAHPRFQISLHPTTSTPPLSPGNDHSSTSESSTTTPASTPPPSLSHRSAPPKSPAYAPSPCHHGHRPGAALQRWPCRRSRPQPRAGGASGSPRRAPSRTGRARQGAGGPRRRRRRRRIT